MESANHVKIDNNIETKENVTIDHDQDVDEKLNQQEECKENTIKEQPLIDNDIEEEPKVEESKEQAGPRDTLESEQPNNSNNDNKSNDTSDSNENNNDVKVIKNSGDNLIENSKAVIPDTEQCLICGQFLNNSDIVYYQGHPQDAVEEFIALTNEKLVLSAGMYLENINSR